MKTFIDDLALLVRAKYPIIAIETHEWNRFLASLKEIAPSLGREVSTWNNIEGLASGSGTMDDSEDPRVALKLVFDACMASKTGDKDEIFVFFDFHHYIEDREILGRLRLLAPELKYRSKTLLLVGPCFSVPRELEKDLTLIQMPLPDSKELAATFERFVAETRTSDGQALEGAVPAELYAEAPNAAQGLTTEEAYNAYIRAYLETEYQGTSDVVASILAQKEQIIRKGGILDYKAPSESLEDVGGLDLLKQWLDSRGRAFYAMAKAFGLPEPRGVLICGVPGCGKSLIAKAVAARWRLPLLRLDVGRVFEGIVGSSEGNIRKAIALSEAISPCVLWLDEVEKGFSGVQSSGLTDGGTTSRVFASFLTWMQEKKKPVFVIATANDLDLLPPELLRKGRFDEVFFVDLPCAQERADIFGIHIRRHGRDARAYDLNILAENSKGFNGAEIEACVQAALFSAFERRDKGDNDADLSMDDLLVSARSTVPLSVIRREQLGHMREIARSRFRQASSTSPDEVPSRNVGRTRPEMESSRTVELR
ncbi:MAG: AAA family ATPase [Spirochaetaceae bacterium]|nr:AAA family ATPase [Spirochaetaceae bacterium]